MSATLTRRLRRCLAGVLVMLAVGAAVSAPAQAARVSKLTTMECGSATLTMYFPELSTGGGYETIYFTPDLYRYTNGSWQLWNASKPWHRATVGPNGILLINGYKWFIHGTQTPVRNVPFHSLSPGWYAVKGSFYNSSSHWAQHWSSGATSCYVS